MRHILLSIIAIVIGAVFACGAPRSRKADAVEKPFTLVIDAGHGGKDSGCVGRMAREKDIVLAVALEFGRKVKEKYGDKVNVVYTRSTDVLPTLQERADVANRAEGDLFVSIHVNSLPEKKAGRSKIKGASVYTCGLHKSESNLEVAMRENSVIELEADYTERYEGFDPDSAESYIIFELSQNMHQQQSISFATLALKALHDKAGRDDFGVRQAGFWVLWATSMPSVLVELDFICNPDQERFLNSQSGRNKCAEALFSAFKEYYGKL